MLHVKFYSLFSTVAIQSLPVKAWQGGMVSAVHNPLSPPVPEFTCCHAHLTLTLFEGFEENFIYIVNIRPKHKSVTLN